MSLSIGTLISLIKLGRRAKKVAKRRKRAVEQAEKRQILQGKVTYIGVGTTVLGQILPLIGISATQGEVEAIVTVVGILVTIYGRWRASRRES